MEKVLIVDDDINICELLRLYLEKNGFITTIANDGRMALKKFYNEKPNIVLLDLMIPEIDGVEVCKEIRKKSTCPIIMLTAKGESDDKILGLEVGADDYVVKPFVGKEVVARVKAVLRRSGVSKPDKGKKIIEHDKLYLNLDNYVLKVNGKEIKATPKEKELLYCIASRPNTVFTRDQLLTKIWGFDFFGDSRTVDVHVRRLRDKLNKTSDKWSIKTVWGVGYKFEVK